MISILDCTLREAPINNMMFGVHLSERILTGLIKANVDIVECGFLKNQEHIQGSTIFNRAEEIEDFTGEKNTDTMYVALVDYGRYDLKFLSEKTKEEIDGIRICFKKGEQDLVIPYAEEIMNKGYKVFIQHVDTGGYSDQEILSFLEKINKLHPYAYSIVDTFGTMYAGDVRRIANLVDYNLDKDIKLGFHGHNNLLMANANAQEFISEMYHKRDIMVDSAILGCGRGAGNANTELLISYINSLYHGHYNLNATLDIIDGEMPLVLEMCTWGYSMPYVISGLHSSHVFNVNYLLKKHNIKLRDLRNIIEMLDDKQRKAYDYGLLDRLYLDYFGKRVDDSKTIEYIREVVKKPVLILAPGKSITIYKNRVLDCISKEHPVIISLNGKMEGYDEDIIFFSSCNRYDSFIEYQTGDSDSKTVRLVTSNIKKASTGSEYVVDFQSIAKSGWVNFDSSAILLLRFLIQNDCKNIFIAGMDGFTTEKWDNYYSEKYITDVLPEDLLLLDRELKEMLLDIKKDLRRTKTEIVFVTPSHYGQLFDNG